MSIGIKSRFFNNARKMAVESIRNPEKMRRLIASALELTTKAGRNAKLQALSNKVQTLIRFVQASISREYNVMPWRSLILSVAALIYFVNAFDAIFDFIPLLGFVDDAAVLTAVLTSINNDLAKFIEWENSVKPQRTNVVDAEFEEVKEG